MPAIARRASSKVFFLNALVEKARGIIRPAILAGEGEGDYRRGRGRRDVEGVLDVSGFNVGGRNRGADGVGEVEADAARAADVRRIRNGREGGNNGVDDVVVD